MYENIDIEHLNLSKKELEDLKAFKFALVASKYKGSRRASFLEMYDHLQRELKEFNKALAERPIHEAKSELADISNLIDLMYDYFRRTEQVGEELLRSKR